MWKIFGIKYVKLVAFCILQMFTSTDVDALNLIYKKKKIYIYIYINKNKKTCRARINASSGFHSIVF